MSSSWRWSGNRFVNEEEEDEEPWEITRVNVEASVVCVNARIEELVRAFAMKTTPEVDEAVGGGRGGRGGGGVGVASKTMTSWLTELSPMLLKLRACVSTMTERAVKGKIAVMQLFTC